jgi:NAD(P)-dependent dehydrogenase (short-subunit alcohol dehydrogenase family)
MVDTNSNTRGHYGIRINCIAPGGIEDTEGFKRLITPGADVKAFQKMVPLGRFGKVDDIAKTAVFLSSDLASYITGTVMVVDGGASLGGDEPFRSSYRSSL